MGYLVYVRPDNVMAVAPFDLRSRRVTGAHVEIASDVLVSGIGFAQFAVAENGTVAYIPGSESDLVRVSRDGQVRVLMEERRRYHSPRISPDGRRIAFDHVSSDGRDVWIWSETEDLTRATFQRDGHDPVWTRDGKGLYYLAGNGGRLDIFRTQLGSTVQPRAESTGVDLSYTGTHLGDDAGFLTTVPGSAGRGLDIVRLVPQGHRVDTVLATAADESYVVPSPDGRWFAYISDHSGRPEVYLRALSGSDVQLQVSVDGASEPIWSRDGQELFYRRATPMGTELVAAALQLDAEPRVLRRTRLFDVSGYDTAAPHANYDVSPDGRWFVSRARTVPTISWCFRTSRAGAPDRARIGGGAVSAERLATALADRYRVERELGQGGMATVYLAEDLKHGRRVAIKVLRLELAAVIGADRFVREIRTIAALQHPHILRPDRLGEVNGTAYYVMPFVEGESLRDRLNREKQLPIPDAVRIASEAAAALDYAHRHGVIHRDIKPENILLHDGSALVADFGIALAVSSAGGSRWRDGWLGAAPHGEPRAGDGGAGDHRAQRCLCAWRDDPRERWKSAAVQWAHRAGHRRQGTTEAPRLLTRRGGVRSRRKSRMRYSPRWKKLPADCSAPRSFAIAPRAERRRRRKTADQHQPKVVGYRQRWLVGLGLVVLPLAAFLWGAKAASPLLTSHVRPVHQGDLGSCRRGAARDVAGRKERRLGERHGRPHAGVRALGRGRARPRTDWMIPARSSPTPAGRPMAAGCCFYREGG